MTVKELKQALAALGSRADDMEVRIWLPGSEIYLCAPNGGPAVPFWHGDKIMIEGNLAEGSALRDDL